MLSRVPRSLVPSLVSRCCCVSSVAGIRVLPVASGLIATPFHVRSFVVAPVLLKRLKETPVPSLFQSRENIEHRIHGLIFDLFHTKLEQSKVFQHEPTPGSSSTEPIYRVDAVTPFKEIGLDSLDIVELLVAVEKEFHIELTDEEYAGVKNVDDIVAKIHGHPHAY